MRPTLYVGHFKRQLELRVTATSDEVEAYMKQQAENRQRLLDKGIKPVWELYTWEEASRQVLRDKWADYLASHPDGWETALFSSKRI